MDGPGHVARPAPRVAAGRDSLSASGATSGSLEDFSPPSSTSGSGGTVSNFDAPWYGSPKATGAGGDGPFTGISAAPGGFGYFVSRANGGIFTYGLAWLGSLAGRLPTGVTGIGVAG